MTPLSDERLLIHIAYVARTRFRLNVWQWLPGHVGAHAPGSLHGQRFPGSNVGRAFDAYSYAIRMARFARWVRRAHGHRMTEVIYNGRFTKVSIKHGQTVSPSFWGAETWAEHRNHVHIGI
ncbi:MAG: hypothetical protein ACXVHX_22740 [Solirubrobacteraceae bacterium]